MLYWHLSNRADPRALPLADRHYNRQKPGSPQFVPPASCVVLLTEQADALWVSLAPIAKYVQHEWAGAWTCTLFRNESDRLSSELIVQAVAATRWHYSQPGHQRPVPEQGFITFVDRDKTRPKKNPGYCYLMAGWTPVGRSQGGLYALQLLPEDMPEPAEPKPMIEDAETYAARRYRRKREQFRSTLYTSLSP